MNNQITEKRNPVKNILYALIFLFFLIYAAGGLTRVGLFWSSGQINSICIGSLLVLVLLYGPAVGRAERHPIYRGFAFFLVGCIVAFSLYYVVFFWDFAVRFGIAVGITELILGVVVMVVVFETVRRTTGLTLLVLVILFSIYPFLANLTPAILRTNASDLSAFVGQVWLSEVGILGPVATVLAEYIFPFTLFAHSLLVSGGGDFFKEVSLAAIGKTRGGTAKAAVLANYFVGMMTGSSVADVATTGPLFIPLMRKTNYSGEYAGGVIAASSTAAQLSPPVMGAVAFIMAQFLGIPYVDIAIMAIVPSFLFYLALLMIIHFDAGRLKVGTLTGEEVPRLKETLRKGWFHIPPLVILIVLLGYNFLPRYCALAAVFSIFLISQFRRNNRTGLRRLWKIAEGTVSTIVPMAPIIVAAGTIIGVTGLTGLSFKLSTELVDLAGGNLYLMLVYSALACIILGMGLPTIPTYIVVSVILAPTLARMGVAQVVSHMFVFYFGLAAMLTPPVAISVYVVMPMTGTGLWRTGLAATRLGIATFVVPFIFVMNPTLLLGGAVSEFLMALFIASLASASLAVGLSGYLARPVGWPLRILLLAGASAPLTPVPYSIMLLGGVPLAALVLWHRLAKR